MRTNSLRWMPQAAITLISVGLCRPAIAQQGSYAMLQPAGIEAAAATPVPAVRSVQTDSLPEAPDDHRFWDRENSLLFAASAAFSTADFVVTRDNLRSGGQELNPLTRVFARSTPTLALNFAGQTAGVVGLSYFFHKTRHHKLERAVSMVNICGSGAAVTFDLTHR